MSGGIVVHGLAAFGIDGLEAGIHRMAEAVGGGVVGWLVSAAIAGIAGLGCGAVAATIGRHVLRPLMRLWTSRRRRL